MTLILNLKRCFSFKTCDLTVRLLTFIFLYSLSSLAFSNSNHFVITPPERSGTNEKILSPLATIDTFEFFSAPTSLSIEEVVAIDSNNWQAISNNQRPRPDDKEISAWYRFHISPQGLFTDQDPLQLVFGWTIIASLQVHIIDDLSNEIISSETVGSMYDFSYQHTKAQNIVFPLAVSDARPLTVYFELPFTRTLLPPISIVDSTSFSVIDRRDHILIGIVMGSLVVMLLYNISLSVLLLNKTYFYYSCYMATVIMYMLPLKGLAFYPLLDGFDYLKANGYSIASCVSFISAILFFGRFLKLKSRGGWVYHLNQFLLILWCILLIPALFLGPYNVTSLISISAIVTCLAATAMALRLAIEKNIMAIIFLIAWSFVLIGTIALILLNFGVIPNNGITSNIQMFGVLIEMILLSFALAFRINRHKAERLTAQKEALLLTKRVSDERRDRLHAQKESLELQQQLNSTLESQVQVRTEQLEDAMNRLEAANAELRTLSVTDGLTGLHNRRYFDESILQEWNRAARNSSPVSIVIADIDHFKPINDTFGHSVGDHCIQAIANSLKDSLRRPSDLLARYGGEEFIFILPGSDAEAAMKVAEHCREAVEKITFLHEGKPIPLSISAGIASCVPTEKNNFQSLINAADTALYQAKSDGRNCSRNVDLDSCTVN